MNNTGKIIFSLIVLIILLIMAPLVILYFSPALQKQIVLRALDDQPKVSAHVDHFKFRFSRMEIRGLSIISDEESLSLSTLEADYSLGGLFFANPRLENLKISGLNLDVAAQSGRSLKDGLGISTTTQYPKDAEVPIKEFQMPLYIGQVRIDGSAQLPDGFDLTFSLKMDDIMPGSTGAVGVDVDVQTRGPDSPFQNAEIRLNGSARQTSEGAFDKLEGQVLGRLLEHHSTEWVEVSMNPRFEGNLSEFEVIVETLKLIKGETLLLEGSSKATGTRQTGEPWLVGYSARFSSDLALVSGLSIVPTVEPLKRGELVSTLSGQFIEGKNATLNGVIEVRNLLPANYNGRPISLKLEPALVADMATEILDISTPIRLVGPRSLSTGLFTAKLMHGTDQRLKFESRIDLDVLDPEEWEPLASIFKEQPAATVPEKDSTPDEEPPWSQLEGRAVASIGKLHLGRSYFDDVALSFSIEEGKTVFAEVAGRSGETPVRSAVRLSFDSLKPSQPYELTGTLNVQGLDVTPFLKDPKVSRPLILEGLFNANGTFQSHAPNPGFLADRLTGDILLESASQGIFRPLGEKTSLATGISGILGALGGNNNNVQWVQEVIHQLKEIPFTQLTFHLGREENLNFFLREFDLVSRETRIKGEGSVEYSAGIPLYKLPIDMRLDLFAKGRLAEALRNGNQLLSEKPDAMGYFPGPPLPIRGSLANPESLLINLLMDSSSQLIPGLLGPRTR